MFSQPFFIPSALIALLSLPLIFGWIPRQSFYGTRTPKTLSSDDIWYPANRFAGIVLVASSCIYFAVAWTLPDATHCYQYWLRDLVRPSGRICYSAYCQLAPDPFLHPNFVNARYISFSARRSSGASSF